VQVLLTAEFGGKAINGYNLHEWRHGGHAEWRRHQEAREIVKDLHADSNELTQMAEGSVVNITAQWLAARYAVAMKRAEGQEADPAANWKRMREFCHDIVALGRGEHRAQRLELVRAGLALRGKNLGLEEALATKEEFRTHPPSHNAMGRQGMKKPVTGIESSKGQHSMPNIQHLTPKENPQRSEPDGPPAGARLEDGKDTY